MRSKGLVAAIENSTDSVNLKVVMQELALLPEAEVVEDFNEIASHGNSIDSAHDDMETMQDINTVMTKASETGEGISSEAAKIANIGIESITRRLGIKTHVMPSMESFSSTNDSKTATKLAIEDIGEAIVRVWTAIKQAILKLWNTIIGFFKKIFNAIASILKINKSLEDSAKDIDDEHVGQKFKDDKICRKFGKDNVTASDVTDILDNHISLCDLGLNESIQGINELVSSLEHGADAAVKEAKRTSTEDNTNDGNSETGSAKSEVPPNVEDKVSDDVNKQALAIIKSIENPSSGNSKKTEDVDGDHLQLPEKGFLVNGDLLILTVKHHPPSDNDGGDFSLSHQFSRSSEYSDAGEYAVIANKSQILKVTATVATLVKATEGMATEVEKFEKTLKSMLAKIDKLMVTVQKKNVNMNGKYGKVLKLGRRIISTTMQFPGTLSASIAGKNLRACKDSQVYVAKCINHYKKSS